MSQIIFTGEERAKIAETIAKAESATSGEIVVILTEASDGYRSFGVLWSALLALILPLVFLVTTDWPLEPVYIAQLLLFLVLLLITQIDWIRIALVPRRIKRARAHARAAEQFVTQNLHTTDGRTGVLFFVSLAERFAEVIADEAVFEKVDPKVWREIVDRFTAQVAQGEQLAAFTEAIEACGAVLAEHFPPGTSGGNELPNHLIVLDVDNT